MYYKIQKSLGSVSAVSVATITPNGIYIEFKNFSQDNASIIVFNHGINEDICINGWTFPCIYNNLKAQSGNDIYGGRYRHLITFDVLDPSGAVHTIEMKNIYGSNETLAVEYFYSLLYNISCCVDIEQSKQLYDLIIDNKYFKNDKDRKKAISVLGFIESFSPHLNDIKDTTFVVGLKQKISVFFKDAQEIIASSSCPL